MIDFDALQLKIEEQANKKIEQNPGAHFEDYYIEIAIEEAGKLPPKDKLETLKEMVKKGDPILAETFADMDIEDSLADFATEVFFRKLT